MSSGNRARSSRVARDSQPASLQHVSGVRAAGAPAEVKTLKKEVEVLRLQLAVAQNAHLSTLYQVKLMQRHVLDMETDDESDVEHDALELVGASLGAGGYATPVPGQVPCFRARDLRRMSASRLVQNTVRVMTPQELIENSAVDGMCMSLLQ
jgi:hypothetical protein